MVRIINHTSLKNVLDEMVRRERAEDRKKTEDGVMPPWPVDDFGMVKWFTRRVPETVQKRSVQVEQKNPGQA